MKNLKAYKETWKYGSAKVIKLTETIPEEGQKSDLLDKDFLNFLKYDQTTKGKHGQRMKENQENNVWTEWQYQ